MNSAKLRNKILIGIIMAAIYLYKVNCCSSSSTGDNPDENNTITIETTSAVSSMSAIPSTSVITSTNNITNTSVITSTSAIPSTSVITSTSTSVTNTITSNRYNFYMKEKKCFI